MVGNKDNTSFRFLDWEVYRDAQAAFMEVMRLVRSLPTDLRLTLGSQIIRSALSVVLNIAEGSGRHTDKELSRFFDISLGSVNETVAALDSLRNIDSTYAENFHILSNKYASISRQLGGFKKRLGAGGFRQKSRVD